MRSGRDTDRRCPDDVSNDPVLWLHPLLLHLHKELLELLDCCLCLVQLGVRATAVGWNSEQNAVLAGDLKCLVYYILTQDEQ